ncbi:MAG: cytochrome C [Planctomycetota bacterium]|nr:MAG: cytochrome C [Planctomycetota bacterium]
MKLNALAATTGILVLGGAAFALQGLWREPAKADPWAQLPVHAASTKHSHLFDGMDLKDGPSVTRACLSCHKEAAHQLMQSSHWTWLGKETEIPGRKGRHRIGKKNLINNFCIGIKGNWETCSRCHPGYGWKDASFNFDNPELVDCLVCHDRSGTYVKDMAGLPAADVDLLKAAQSVGRTSRDSCGTCHFNGGGGDAVKHGDLDLSLSTPSERVDVHMGRHDFTCTDCHVTQQHHISGKILSISPKNSIGGSCQRCHGDSPHQNQRLDAHVRSVACQTCHIPVVAKTQGTKVAWDWSTAGREGLIDDPHRYLKIKGSFLYARNLVPEYYWFNGDGERYLLGDVIDPEQVTKLNRPLGDIDDPRAKIWPFKVHRGKQPYDAKEKRLISPMTHGKGGFWNEFDWQKAAQLGGEITGLPFSGQMGFVETKMYWPLNHMVSPKERALQCTDCHSEDGRSIDGSKRGRLDWQRLGYEGDPAFISGKRHRQAKGKEAGR